MSNPNVSIYELIALSIDFEGCIRLGQITGKSHSVRYQPKVEISNTSKALLEYFKQRVGFGSVSDGHTAEGKARSYVWQMRIREIKEYLPLIEPHLVLKREQARLIIESLSILRTRKEHRKIYKDKNPCGWKTEDLYTEKEMQRLRIIFLRLQELNRKNKPESLTDAEKLLREFQKQGFNPKRDS